MITGRIRSVLLRFMRTIQQRLRSVASQHGPFQPTLQRRWPVGQFYGTLTTTDQNNRAWVEYKLIAAEWYLDTLTALENRTGELSRLVGEEMALDGVLVGLSSAFDAAVAGLITAIETSRGTPGALPPHRYDWPNAKQLAAGPPAILLTCMRTVDAALVGANQATPTGWLARLRRLRNRAAHQNTIVRHYFRTIAVGAPVRVQQPSQIDVPGLGGQDPIPYLRAQLNATRSVCATILKDSDTINP